ncbi:MAG: hypothetical protein RL022_268, partial [Chloroflexota bacterium]
TYGFVTCKPTDLLKVTALAQGGIKNNSATGTASCHPAGPRPERDGGTARSDPCLTAPAR